MTSRIAAIQFSILSPEEIRRQSVVEVVSRDTYNGSKPVPGGLFDPRMGVLEPGLICPTDGLDYNKCPGYPGHIELARPVFNTVHMNTIIKICKCICFKCSKPLINKLKHEHILKYSADKRWEYVERLCKNVKRCGQDSIDGCGYRVPEKIKLDSFATVLAFYPNMDHAIGKGGPVLLQVRYTPEMLLKVFRRISDEDVTFLGFHPLWSRPEWMILTVLPVAPPAVRPSVKHDAQQRSEDDLTHIYNQLLKTNSDLAKKIQENQHYHAIDSLTTVLQYFVAMISNNKIKGADPMSQRNGRPLQCIMGRLNGKSGRIRGNLMGKRVDFSARSVITGDPNISVRQLGVPLKIAKNLTKPVCVNEKNRAFLMQLVLNGPDIHPGAKILEKRSGESISLRHVDRKNVVLDFGDVVHRHIIDGDAVLFNRQPSLHRVSMMCHIVKVMAQGDTFRMNIAATKCYNADFDGDEMNLFAPQNVLAESELRNLAAIPYQIISSGGNAPIIGIFQDSLLGAFQFTRQIPTPFVENGEKKYKQGVLSFTPRQAMNLLMSFPKVDVVKLKAAIDPQTGCISSYDLLSQILPPLTLKYKIKDSETNVLEIRNGEYISGQIEKSVLAGGTKGIIHRIMNDFGPLAATDFIDDFQNIVTEYMKTCSFSVGIKDLIADRATSSKIIETIQTKKLEVQSLMDQVHLGVFKNETANTDMVELESRINNLLNKASEQSGKIGRESLDKNNRFVQIVTCGSKGSPLNIAQMVSCLGQQNVEGKRVPYGFDNRTLPHYTKFDDSPNARGFIESSYISGLKPSELFMHAMGGRVGLIDTAIKSLGYDSIIAVIENKIPKIVKIGEWIDGHLAKADPSDVEHSPNDRNMELLNLDDEVFIPTMNDDGEVTWGQLTAVTRHDPGERLYEIKTQGGREVTVAESESLLIWDDRLKWFQKKHSKLIQVGDFVPVTMNLPEPPVVLNYVDTTPYFPKNEYIHGSDFHLADRMMKEAMQTKLSPGWGAVNKRPREKNPRGWWNDHNGVEFTLPYTKKASLQRTVSGRSNIDNIVEGYIYPYHARRTEALFPARFELNEENGIFLGLFLADGNVHEGCVYITKNNEQIRAFLRYWYEKNQIKSDENVRVTDFGTIHSTRAYNTLLARFLTAWVGHGAAHKHFPDEAFVANLGFVKGLINGYISGDGCVSDHGELDRSGGITVSSVSYRLIEGLSMLCTRIGIFGNMSYSQSKANNVCENPLPTNTFSIRAQWGQIFTDKITLLEPNKNARLQKMNWCDSHKNFKSVNDVIQDKIVSIRVVGVEGNPKLYDVTVPSTLNLSLANGLHTADTSTTGYIQRRLIKGLEDLKVEYDMTVRNSKGKVIQFAYGDDGFESMRVENQSFPLVEMSLEDIYMHFEIPELGPKKDNPTLAVYTKEAAKRLKSQETATREWYHKAIQDMIEARDLVITNVFRNKHDKTVRLPVAFLNIIANIQGQLGLTSHSVVDITPMEAVEMCDEALNRLKRIHYAAPTPLFEILFRFYTSPRQLLSVKRFHRKALVLLLETIVLKYKEAIVHPGEMVGVVAGQSTGEPTTQLTLNSVTYETEILVRNQDKRIKSCQIGDFITGHIEKSRKDGQAMVEYIADKNTTYAELTDYYEIQAPDESGAIEWCRIEAVTQHPVINKDGTDTMLKFTTKGQREVIVTKAKSLLKVIDGKVLAASGDSFKVGEHLLVSRKAIDFEPSYELDLKTVLSPTEYIYGSEIKKAKVVCKEYHWFKNHSQSTFKLPYKHVSALTRAMTRGKVVINDGYIYTKTNNICNYTIPEKIDLDYDFGYLVGAYAAEGCCTQFQLSIANNDIKYFEPIHRLCTKFNLTTKIYKHENKIQEGWTSTDLRIYSSVLTRLMGKLCGNLSHNKYVHDSIIFSNEACQRGFLDAYIGGDGSVDANGVGITAGSVSLKLLQDIQMMLQTKGIQSKVRMCKQILSNNRGTLPENIHQGYSLCLGRKDSIVLSHQLNILLDYKQKRLEEYRSMQYKNPMGKCNEFYSEVGGIYSKTKRDGKMDDIDFDEIISIEEVPNTTPFAYDLTVEKTRNFVTRNAVTLFDTFHNSSGAGSKSNVTRGVPRIEEILRLTENPKNPSLTVHLKPYEESNEDKAAQYALLLEHTKLVDVVKYMAIVFDPMDTRTLIEEDRELLRRFQLFQEMIQDCVGEGVSQEIPKSKWIVRMEMNTEVMLDKNITMDDIHFAIRESFLDKGVNGIDCIYTDYNADKLVFRLRVGKTMLKYGKPTGGNDPLDQSDEIYVLKNFQDSILNNVVLRGVKGINNVLPRKVPNSMVKEDGKFIRKDTYVLDTTGSNLLDTLALDYVDENRTYSNDIREVFDVLGIEAAREVIFNEFTEVMEFSDVYINYHHLSLLCDRMCQNKDLVSIFRSGILSDDIGPIAKSTFEVHTEVILKAARHAELDSMRGVSANIMYGQYGFYGTNAFQVILDMTEMHKLEETRQEQDDAMDVDSALQAAYEKDDMGCHRMRIENTVETVREKEGGARENDGYQILF